MADGMRNPEWMLGGPFHGKDCVTAVPPHARAAHSVIVRQPVISWAEWDGGDLAREGALPACSDTTYRRSQFVIGQERLTLWVAEGVGGVEAWALLAEILLAPHRVPVEVASRG